MKFHYVPDVPEEMLTNCLESETGLVQICIWRVMFGYRVRAGFRNAGFYWLDWCAGHDMGHVESLHKICVQILESRPEDRDCFRGIPRVSSVKPYFNDPEFLREIAQILDGILKQEIEESSEKV